MKINLNQQVKVTLTPYGKKKLAEVRRKMLQEFPQYTWETYIPDGDFFTCPFWRLFEIFDDGIRPEPFLMDVELL